MDNVYPGNKENPAILPEAGAVNWFILLLLLKLPGDGYRECYRTERRLFCQKPGIAPDGFL